MFLTFFLSLLCFSQALTNELPSPTEVCVRTGGRWDTCGSGCGPLTCEKPELPEICTKQCLEQCNCGDGNVWDKVHGCKANTTCASVEPEEPQCDDGEVDNSDPCMIKRCSDGRWVTLIVDCLPPAACPGGWNPPADGKCCGTCKPEEPSTRPPAGEDKCFEKRVETDKCFSEEELRERASGVCQEGGGRLVGIEFDKRCEPNAAGEKLFSVAAYKCCRKPEEPGTRPPASTRPPAGGGDDLDVGTSCFEVTLRGKGSTCGSLLKWHRFAASALGGQGFLYIAGVTGQGMCARQQGAFSQARVRACVMGTAALAVALPGDKLKTGAAGETRAGAAAPALRLAGGASVLLGADEVYTVDLAEADFTAAGGEAAAGGDSGGVSVVPIVGGAGVAMVAAAVVAVALAVRRQRRRGGAASGAGVVQSQRARVKAANIEYPNGSLAAYRADPITVCVAPVVVE